ncbi:MAG: hypothetical protein R3C19_12160 [Planctomycetaceae bacterium]
MKAEQAAQFHEHRRCSSMLVSLSFEREQRVIGIGPGLVAVEHAAHQRAGFMDGAQVRRSVQKMAGQAVAAVVQQIAFDLIVEAFDRSAFLSNPGFSSRIPQIRFENQAPAAVTAAAFAVDGMFPLDARAALVRVVFAVFVEFVHVADHNHTLPRFAGTFKTCIAGSQSANASRRRGHSQHGSAIPPPAFLFPLPESPLLCGHDIGTI